MRDVSRRTFAATMLAIVVLAIVMPPAAASAQAHDATADSVVAALARVIGASLDSEYVTAVRAGHAAMPLIVDAPSIGMRTLLEAQLVRSAHSRVVAPGDSDAHEIRVRVPAVHGDSATVRVYDARLQCRQRFEAAAGSLHRYDFVRDGSTWRFARYDVEEYYDPPPPLPPGIMSSGCPDFHVPDHPLPLDSARTLADTLQSLERASWVARQDHDSTFFSHFLAPDHVETGASGRISRATVLAGVATRACVLRSYMIDSFRTTRIDEHTAVFTYHVRQATRCNGVAVSSPAWATSVYVFRDGHWLNAAYQQTPTPEPPKYPLPN